MFFSVIIILSVGIILWKTGFIKTVYNKVMNEWEQNKDFISFKKR